MFVAFSAGTAATLDLFDTYRKFLPSCSSMLPPPLDTVCIERWWRPRISTPIIVIIIISFIFAQ
jgi:hypothetical protein